MAFVSAITVNARPLTLHRSNCGRGPRMDLATPITQLAANPPALNAVADSFNTLNLPPALVKWGHPAMMAVLVVGMGASGGAIGWAGRLNKDKKAGVAQKNLHENIMLAFTLLATLGGIGGTLSTAMQGYDVWESPHFISAAVLLTALTANAVLAYTGFSLGGDGSPKARLAGRTAHAWFGVATMTAFLVHAYLGYMLTQ